MVAKWGRGTYQTDGRRTSWLMIKNPAYTQIQDRHEMFERRHSDQVHRRSTPLNLHLA